jgi:hypothetical protein
MMDGVCIPRGHIQTGSFESLFLGLDFVGGCSGALHCPSLGGELCDV